jgi:hypothetical protein
MTKEEAMQNYIDLYNKITNNTYEEEGDMDLQVDNFTYSSTAKHAKQEITEFLENSSDNEKLIHKLKDKIYQGDIITKDYLDKFCNDNNFDRIII